MATLKCTGLNCPVQYNYADPKTCAEPEKCRFATFPQTNADRIRAMTDEELAEYLVNIHYCPAPYFTCDHTKECEECWGSWLRSPVEDGEK